MVSSERPAVALGLILSTAKSIDAQCRATFAAIAPPVPGIFTTILLALVFVRNNMMHGKHRAKFRN